MNSRSFQGIIGWIGKAIVVLVFLMGLDTASPWILFRRDLAASRISHSTHSVGLLYLLQLVVQLLNSVSMITFLQVKKTINNMTGLLKPETVTSSSPLASSSADVSSDPIGFLVPAPSSVTVVPCSFFTSGSFFSSGRFLLCSSSEYFSS